MFIWLNPFNSFRYTINDELFVVVVVPLHPLIKLVTSKSILVTLPRTTWFRSNVFPETATAGAGIPSK